MSKAVVEKTIGVLRPPKIQALLPLKKLSPTNQKEENNLKACHPS